MILSKGRLISSTEKDLSKTENMDEKDLIFNKTFFDILNKFITH